MAFNGTRAEDLIPPRHIVQWVIDFNDGDIKILGFCIRDRDTPEWTTVFEHESEEVCRKLANVLNERT